jgi:Ethylbenzene dehydrogenase
MKRSKTFTAVGLLLLVAFAGSCRKATQTTPEVVVVDAPKIALDPADPAWQPLPEHVAALLPQDIVDPRLMEPSTPEVRVQAMTDGANIAFRLSWLDALKSNTPGPAKFSDACAVQLPKTVSPDLPAPQMGEATRPVEIVYWRASWQAVVDGRGDTIKDLYPNAAVDHYPFEAAPLQQGSPEQKEMATRYAPARAVGNTMAGPRQTPVECLVAEGPGTLTPNPEMKANGKGKYDQDHWTVVIVRPIPDAVKNGQQDQIAFAVWQGAHMEVGSRKMRSGWVPLVRKQVKP